MPIKGILFDMDGVLVDSEEIICEAAIQMFAEHNVVVQPSDFLEFVGAGENRYLGGVAEKYNFAFDLERDKARAYAIYDQKVVGRLKPLPGVIDFIAFCKYKGIKIAVATSADEVKMLINLREMGISASIFDATVNGSEVTHKKPDPEIFILAASKLGLMASECLVVEDAINGVMAANAAGCACLALTTSFPATLLIDAQWITSDLSDVPQEIISQL